MQIIMLAGFLGSGKTTLLLELARYLTGSGRSVAVIENDVGSVGVDGRRLAAEGLTVREIASGCICCSLAGDLVATVEEVQRQFAPDILLLEPSGVAAPGQVSDVLQGMESSAPCHRLVLLDAARWTLLKKRAALFVQGSLQQADAAVITKADVLPEAELQIVLREVRALRPGLAQLPLSVQSGQGLPRLFDWIEQRLLGEAATPLDAALGSCADSAQPLTTDPSRAAKAEPSEADKHAQDSGPERLRWSTAAQSGSNSSLRGSVCAKGVCFTFDPALPAEEVPAWLSGVMRRLAEAVRQTCGEEPLGHLKAVARVGQEDLFANVDRFDRPAQIHGTLAAPARKVELCINAIVASQTLPALPHAVATVLEQLTTAAR